MTLRAAASALFALDGPCLAVTPEVTYCGSLLDGPERSERSARRSRHGARVRDAILVDAAGSADGRRLAGTGPETVPVLAAARATVGGHAGQTMISCEADHDGPPFARASTRVVAARATVERVATTAGRALTEAHREGTLGADAE